MAAPWGAIIQAVDHAMGRTQEGMMGGIKVADSQHGGGMENSGSGGVVDTSKAGNAMGSAVKSGSELDVKDKIGSSESAGKESLETSAGGDISSGGAEADAGGGGGADMGGGGMDMGADASSIASDKRLKHARECAESTVKKWRER